LQPIEDNSLHKAVLRQFSLNIINPENGISNNSDDNFANHNNDILFKFVFLRHPFERLVSAFYDKFVEDPDPLFVKSVVHHEPVDAEHLRWTFKKFEKEKKFKIKIQDVIAFPRFVKFVLYELEQKKISHGTYHWIPYTEFCGICKINYDFIGKLETLQNDLDYLKLKFPVEVREKIDDIFALKKNAALGKSHETSEMYFKQLPKKLILKLYQAYKQDFAIGGYPYPEKYISLGS
jgi:chondroitin 4-sulfotransferase 11